LAFYEFGRKVGVKYGNENHFDAYINYSKNCGWAYLYDGLAIVSDRPRTLKFDDRRRLHCENGPAISYGDGCDVYSWHGTGVPKEWISENPTAKTALTWENLEQRRAACEIVGWANILRELNAISINADSDPEIGELLEVEIPDIGKEKFLRVLCGTQREFALPVPPEMKTAHQANAWTWGLDINDYQPEVRT
jgi:hypothetical protein